MDVSLPTPKRACHLAVNVVKHHSHDFRTGNPLLVSFQVTAENTGAEEARLHLKADKDWYVLVSFL